jgi:hypothetical protein
MGKAMICSIIGSLWTRHCLKIVASQPITTESADCPLDESGFTLAIKQDVRFLCERLSDNEVTQYEKWNYFLESRVLFTRIQSKQVGAGGRVSKPYVTCAALLPTYCF